MNLELKVPPVIVFLIDLLLVYFIKTVNPCLNFKSAYNVEVAIVCTLLGALFAIIAIYFFIKAKTTVNPHKPSKSSTLVTSGIYKITRNPMYVGLLLILISYGIYLSNIASILSAAFFIIYIDRFQIRPEERHLQQIFGDQFTTYKAKVRRWL